MTNTLGNDRPGKGQPEPALRSAKTLARSLAFTNPLSSLLAALVSAIALSMLAAFPAPVLGQFTCVNCPPSPGGPPTLGGVFMAGFIYIDSSSGNRLRAGDNLEIQEGGSVTLQIRLSNAPLANTSPRVVIGDAFNSANRDLTYSPSTLTFTSSDHGPKSITVTAAEDADMTDDRGRIVFYIHDGDARVYIADSQFRGFTITDNDKPPKGEIKASASGSITPDESEDFVITEGTSGMLSVSLDTAPNADVTVSITGTHSQMSFSPSTLTFTTANYATPQTVTVTVAYDDNDTTDTGNITLSATGGVDANDVTRRFTINEPSTPPSGEIELSAGTVNVTEGSTTGSPFTVKLSEQPSASVTVSLAKTNDDVTLSPTSLTFTTSNYGTAQDVTVKAGHDDDATDDTDNISVSATGGIVASEVFKAVSVQDDDGSIVIDPATAITLEEDGGEDRTGTFTVKLGAAPTSTAVLSVTSGDTGAVGVSPATLTFDSTNHDTAQTVTLTAHSDDDALYESVVITLAVVSGIRAADATKTVKVEDDDGGISLGSGGDGTLALVEGSGNNGTLSVTLVKAPSGNVTIDVTSDDTGAVTVSPATLTFNSSNYSTAQTITLAPVADADGTDESVVITLKVSAASEYNSAPVMKSVSVTDDDGGIDLSSAAVAITEGGDKKTFTVTLDAAPASSAMLSVTVGDPEAVLLEVQEDISTPLVRATRPVQVSSTTLTFTSSNYSTEQTITLVPVDDDDGTDESVDITFSVTEGYTADDETKSISISDDDGEIVLDDTGDLTLSESDPGTFRVKLDAPPVSRADLSVAISDTAVARLSPAMLSFTPDNYDQYQTVTVTPENDSDSSNESATVTLAVSGSGYTAASQTKTVKVIDDDGILLDLASPMLALSEEGDGSSASFTVRLGGRPSANAMVTVTSSDTGAVSVSPATLTFMSGNYGIAQSVTVSAVDDTDAADETVTITLASTSVSSDMTVAVSVTDNDGGIELDNDNILSIAEGGSDTFTVKLPLITSDVVLSISSSEDGKDEPKIRSVSPKELTFTSSNYSTAQTVTVQSNYDDDAMDDEDISIIVSAKSGMTAPDVIKKVTLEEPDSAPKGNMVVTPTGAIAIDEGQSKSIEVALDKQPSAAVSVALSLVDSDDRNEITFSPASLVFGVANWMEKQTVLVVSEPDDDDESESDIEIEFEAVGGLDAEAVKKAVNITDRISGGSIVVNPAETLTITEGGSGVLTVNLGSLPSADVNVSLSKVADEITLSESSLTFTPSNWSEEQVVTVGSSRDTDTEDEAHTIVIKVTKIVEVMEDGVVVGERVVDDESFPERRIEVRVRDVTEYLPVKAQALALPPATVQDSSTLRVHCKQDSPCFVMLDCTAQDDGSLFEGWISDAIPAHGARTLTAADIERYTGASWSGKGRLGCALRSEQNIGAQVWTRSGDGVLVNNSAAIHSAREGTGYRVDIESIPEPGGAEESNLRIRCLAPEGEHCSSIGIACFDDEGTMYDGGVISIRRLTVHHLQSEALAQLIGHRWTGMGLSCEIVSENPLTVQVLTRTGGGGALVNNSATGRGRER